MAPERLHSFASRNSPPRSVIVTRWRIFHFKSSDDVHHRLGWWLLPLAVTVLSYGYAVSKFTSGRGEYSFPDVWNGFLLIIATIPALIAWIIWALLA